MSATGCRQVHGFTLAELLVVVSIIALLMSLLAPSLTRAQRQAEQVHCLANQRQLTLAWIQYAGDHGDRLCDPDSFTSLLQPYTRQIKEVYVCKGIQDRSVSNSYGLSNTLAGEARDDVKPYVKLHHVTRPSEKMAFVDVELRSSTCFWPVLRSEGQWIWRPWSWPPWASLQGMTARHSNGCNMTFADGHVAYYRWSDGRTIGLIKGLIADPSQASSENADLEYVVRILTHPPGPSDGR